MSPLDARPSTLTRDGLVAGFAASLHADQIERLFDAARPGNAQVLPFAHERVRKGANQSVADQLRLALDLATKHGFFRELAFALGNQIPTSQPTIVLVQGLFDRKVPADAVRFEALANVLTGFDVPDQVEAGMHRGRLNTCKIEVAMPAPDAPVQGTGFLLRTDLVLTSFHVFENTGCIQPAAGLTAQGRFQAAPGAAAKISIVFNNLRNPVLGGNAAGHDVRVDLDDNWLVAASSAAAIGPANLDYVLIKLATCPPTLPAGLERAPDTFPLTPEDRAKVYLFQHPRGAPIRVAQGPFHVRSDTLARDGLNVNALGGSSGGPYTDRRFRVFALHEGTVADRGQLPELQDAVNLAVPLPRILADIGDWPPLGIRPKVFVVDGPFGRQPLIGRDPTCAFVAKALQPDGPRLLILRPEAGDTGLGLTFTTSILKALLSEQDHMILRLGQEQGWHTMSPLRFCETVLGVPTGGARLRTQGEADTTLARWLAGPLLDDLRAALGDQLKRPDGQGQRTLWLVLDDLEKVEITPGTGLNTFLMELYREAARSDWLRIVLLGYRGERLDPVTYRTETEDVRPLNPDGIERYLNDLDSYIGGVAAGNSRQIAELAMDALALFQDARNRAEAIARFVMLFAERTLG